MNIFSKIALHLKIINRFRPYFINIEKHMFLLEIINDVFDEDIVFLYDEMSKLPPNKYKRDRAKYEEYIDKINVHNEEVTFINKVLSEWDYEDFILNPRKYGEDYLNNAVSTKNLLVKYKKLPDECITFKKQQL